MTRLQQIRESYHHLPARPFPEETCTVPMSNADKKIFRERVGKPIEALYNYNKEQMEMVFEEFGL